MQPDTIPYKRIIFVCCNQRDEGKECCNNKGGSEIRDKLKRAVAEYGIKQKIRVCKSGCMGQCGTGVNIMIFPDNIWLKNLTTNDIPKIINDYIDPLK